MPDLQSAAKTPFWITREKALALGFNHEGTHFGIPIFCKYDENDPEVMGDVVAKCAALEPVITLCLYAFMLLNSMRPPGEESEFPFVIRPIEPTD